LIVRGTPPPEHDWWYGPVRGNTGGLALHRAAGIGGPGFDLDLALTAVYGAVRVLSGDNSAQPIHLLEDTGNGRTRVRSHSLYDVLRYAPNPEMSATDLRKTWLVGLCLRGNAYTFIERNTYDRPIGLWPLEPDRVTPVRDADGELAYEYHAGGGNIRTLKQSEVLHFKGVCTDGLTGLSPITVLYGPLDAARLAEEQARRAFDGSNQRLFFETEEKLTAETRDELSESYHKKYAGPANAGKVPFLGWGLKAKTLSISPADLQLLESRKYDAQSICMAAFGVPGFRCGIAADKTETFASIDAHQLAYAIYTMLPINVGIEQELMRKLLTRKERETLAIEHLMDGLLRADPKTQSEILSQGVMHGRLMPNEVRDMDNRGRLGPEGDRAYMPSTMVPMGYHPDAKDSDEGTSDE